MTHQARFNHIEKLMLSCASVALATGLAQPQAAAAQAFQGAISSSTGSVSRATLSGTSEQITIGSDTATINWSPSDQRIGGGAIDFLPTDNTATFTSAQGVTDYTVLNRIIPTDPSRAVALNGHVISTLQGTDAVGGKVWFYSPGGLAIGATAVFDVGGLLLTANDVTNFGANSAGFGGTFTAPASSTSKVTIADGARINALQQNSYVAIVAPRIEQSGTVRVNGSAAYVAGEAVTLSMNQGLFDIQIDAGTSDSEGIVHTGTTGGPADPPNSWHHNIYIVAVPKNQAMTMLLGGNVGFDATEASVDNGAILLSAGRNVSGRQFPQSAANASAGPAAIQIDGGHFTSTTTALASSYIEADASGSDLTFDHDLTLNAGDLASLVADEGQSISIGGNLQIFADQEILLGSYGGSISANSLLARSDGVDSGGFILLGAVDGSEGQAGTLSFGSSTISASGTGSEGMGGTIAVYSEGNSSVGLGHANIFATGPAGGGTITLAAGSCFCDGERSLVPEAQTESTGGISASDLYLIAGADLDMFVSGGADIQLGGTNVAYAGELATLFGDGSSSAIRAHDLKIQAPMISDQANVIADKIEFTGLDGLLVGDLNATDSIALNSGGDLTAGNLTAGGSVQVAAHGVLTMGDVSAPEVMLVALGNGETAGTLNIGDVTGSHVTVSSDGDTNVGNVHSTGAAVVVAGHDLQAGNATAGSSLDIHIGGDGEVGDLQAATILQSADGSMSFGAINTTGSAAFYSGQTLDFRGNVRAPTITVTSSGLDIAQNATLGVNGVTNLVTINAVSHGQPIVIGDNATGVQEGQYVLNPDGEIRGASVVVNATTANNGAAPDVRIFDVDIAGTGIPGGGIGSVAVNTDGNILVLGDVRYQGVGANDTLTLNGGNSIQVSTDTGSIVLTDSAGHLAGHLALNADNVWVADASVLSQLAANPNFPTRDTALGTNNGANNPDGFVRAGSITSEVANSFLVQNSGTAEQFAGIDAGAGGVAITSNSTTPATVIAYGRQTQADGTLITNENFLASVQLSGTGGFTNDSEVNGCAVGGGPCHDALFAFDPSSVLGGITQDDSDSDKDKKDQDSDENGDSSAVDPALRLINTTPVNLDRQIDTPVTSGGDLVVGGPGGEI